MAKEMVKIVDKSLRLAYKRMRAEMAGKRSFAPARKFLKYKKNLLHEPWEKEGIDEKGRTGVWPDISPATIARKRRRTKRYEHESARYGRKGAVIEVGSFGYGMMLYESGRLYNEVKVSHSPKKSQFIGSAPGVDYAYIHMVGMKRTTKGGRHLYIPKREWFIWTIKDQMYLVKLLEKWGAQFGDALKRAA